MARRALACATLVLLALVAPAACSRAAALLAEDDGLQSRPRTLQQEVVMRGCSTDPCTGRPGTTGCVNLANGRYACTCQEGLNWDMTIKACLSPSINGFLNPSTFRVMQVCRSAACQGWVVVGGLYNVYSQPASSGTALQDWTVNDRGNGQFALESAGSCVDICSGPECGTQHGNIIFYPCHYGANQRWYYDGEADQYSGRMLRAVSTGRCLTSCPKANDYCAFAGDVSTAPCDANDPAQRWTTVVNGGAPPPPEPSPAPEPAPGPPQCSDSIAACAPKRCTVRTLDNRDTYVCLRCQAGHLGITGPDGSSIVQCVCRPGFYQALKDGTTNQYQCRPCPLNSFCPGYNGPRSVGLAAIPSINTGELIPCNPPLYDGLITKAERSSRRSDCWARGGFVLPQKAGDPAPECTNSTYSPGPYNRLVTCVRCPAGFATPANYPYLQDDKNKVCQLPPGRYLDGGLSITCPVGTYRSGMVLVTDIKAIQCMSCPTGWTTTIKGATSVQACNQLLPGYMIAGYTPGDLTATLPLNLHAVGGPGNPTNVSFCPIGFFGNGTTLACIRCPSAATTRDVGSTTADDCAVPPGYYIKTAPGAAPRLDKCVTDVATGQGYYRTGWVAVSEASGADSAAACTACGKDILAALVDVDEASAGLVPNDPRPGYVASTSTACYILPGWGMGLDTSLFANGTYNAYMAIKPCPANMYGAVTTVYGLGAAPCKPCPSNLLSAPGSAGFNDCKNPKGYSYTSEGANQCPDNSYAPKGRMGPCQLCPDGRVTAYVPGNGTFQASVRDCKVPPGYGVFSNDAAQPWAPANADASMPAVACPAGLYQPGDSDAGQPSRNPTCLPCPRGQWSSAAGSAACDVCAPGWGIPSSKPNSTSTSDCAPCESGKTQDGSSLWCSACPSTAFNHPVGDKYTSYGVTFTSATGVDGCVPRYAQLPAPAGARLALPDSLFAVDAGAADMAACMAACDPSQCCVVQWEAGGAGTCKRAELAPVGPAYSGAAFFYKPPPSQLVAGASADKVTAKTTQQTGAGAFARCAMGAPMAALAAAGKVGTPPDRALVEAVDAVSWGECADEAACAAKCATNAACWGWIYVPGKGFALRGGEDQIGVRSWFASPDWGRADLSRAPDAKCPAGTGGLFTCEQRCPAGTYNDGTFRDCEPCPAGTSSAAGARALAECVAVPRTTCNAGYGGAPACTTQCAPGTFNNGMFGSCQACDADETSQAGASFCTPLAASVCDAGYGDAAGAKEPCTLHCRSQSPPAFNDGTTDACRACPAGQEPNNKGTACVAPNSQLPGAQG
ncbi:hypothetical protein HT031_004353 [Scenedesmus sp. PABB004]|nr:hypothetical protein HT031_004353 [Scenedesmus sp. PABB004]